MDDNGIFTIPDGTIQVEEYILQDVECDTVLGIIFPSSVLLIDLEAFFCCGNLRSVDMSGTRVTIIGVQAFAGCASLISAIIPASVTSIKRGAFAGCTSLRSFTIPNISTIEERVFDGCTSLTSLFIPDCVTTIEEDAFSFCSSLKIMNIPDTVTKIGARAFSACTSLTTVMIRPGKSLFSFSSAALRSASVLAAQAAAAASVAVVSAAAAASAPVAAEEAAAAAVAAAKAAVSAFAHAAAFASVAATTADGGDGDDAAPMDVWSNVFELPPLPHADPWYRQAPVPFEHVTKIWANDAIVNKLTGPFKGCTCLADVPRAMRVAPDATTWVAVELWLWWSPPTAAGYADKTRTVCTSRQRALFTTMLSAYRTSRPPLVESAVDLCEADILSPTAATADASADPDTKVWCTSAGWTVTPHTGSTTTVAATNEDGSSSSSSNSTPPALQVAPEHQLPALPQELWVVIFGFVKHDQVPV